MQRAGIGTLPPVSCPILPATIPAGMTFSRTVTLADYPAPAWALSVVLRGAGSIDLAATANGTAHVLAADADTTGAWPPGDYWFSGRVTNTADGTVSEVNFGQVKVLPNLADASAGFDGRTSAQRGLDSIEAVLENRATKDQQRYTINNRELWRTPIPELLLLRDRYRVDVRREKAAAAGVSLFGAAVRVRF